MLNSHADRPLYKQLADALRDDLSNGRFKPGESLPSEIELCTLYTVRRPSVRKALALLREEGLITTRRGERSVVRRHPDRIRKTITSGCIVRCRVPSHPERTSLGVDNGVAVIEVHHPDGTVDWFPSDAVELEVLSPDAT
jgi:DNA-binding transcriptional regulator YhcF (GntR family)